ncbi:MAG: hypothetical protein Q9218_003635 [Villophora microphyllina]
MDMEEGSETSPECYATDDAFLQTLAYCISVHCQDVPVWQLERYWLMNVAGTRPIQPVPKATYERTVANITKEPLATLVLGADLDKAVIVSDGDYEASYNAQGIFEKMERNHETYGIVLIVTASAIPIVLSLLRFLPFPAAMTTKFNASFIDPPVFGSQHKAPIAGLFHMPTRGQAFFISYLVAINIILSAVGFRSLQPNSWYPNASGSDGEIVSYLTNRLGVLSFANIALLFLYAGRNNVLLWMTNWSHGTFLLLHRWVAWIATLQAVLHSAIYLHIYLHDGTHASESKLPYWIWGIIATLCMSILLATSILPIRKSVYEFFLAWHVLLSVFVLIGCLWHILERFQRQWGYENWIYTAIAIWGFERAMRIARLARNGVKTAQVTVIDEDYIVVDIKGVSGSGHAYLYFPTLTWRVWENHPFSVASAVHAHSEPPRVLEHSIDIEKSGSATDSSDSDSSERRYQPHVEVGLTFLLRTKTGVTKQLREHAALPALVESAYGPHEDLSEYSLLICIAGGVGITACLPYLRAHPGATKLFWGVRSRGIIDAMAPSLTTTEREVFVGKRMNVAEVLHKELDNNGGTTVVLVSGPSEMADEVRCVVSEIGRQKKDVKVKLLEEAFTSTVPSSLSSLSKSSSLNNSQTSPDSISIRKRTTFNSVTLANGWQVRYELFSLIMPAAPALLDLRHLYKGIIRGAAAHSMFDVATADTITEFVYGGYKIWFAAEPGYGQPVGWDIIRAFAEKMLESSVPITFGCHVAPPEGHWFGNGIWIRLFVGDDLI